GIDPLKHGIVSIGAVDFRNPKNQFYVECRLDDDQEILMGSPANGLLPVSEVTGFSDEDMRDPSKPSIKEALESFMDWFSSVPDRIIIAQNYLDVMFLEIACR